MESAKQKVAIPADVFLNHVANLHCEADEGEGPFLLKRQSCIEDDIQCNIFIYSGFGREFEKLTCTREKQFSTAAATLPGNRDKNRYNNVLPCE